MTATDHLVFSFLTRKGTSEPAAATALAGLRREVQAVVIELCTMAAVAHPLQLLPHALTCLQNGQLQLILQPQARPLSREVAHHHLSPARV